MNIDQALLVIGTSLYYLEGKDAPSILNSLELAREAFLAIKGYRLTKDDSLLLKLPGETVETDSP